MWKQLYPNEKVHYERQARKANKQHVTDHPDNRFHPVHIQEKSSAGLASSSDSGGFSKKRKAEYSDMQPIAKKVKTVRLAAVLKSWDVEIEADDTPMFADEEILDLLHQVLSEKIENRSTEDAMASDVEEHVFLAGAGFLNSLVPGASGQSFSAMQLDDDPMNAMSDASAQPLLSLSSEDYGLFDSSPALIWRRGYLPRSEFLTPETSSFPSGTPTPPKFPVPELCYHDSSPCIAGMSGHILLEPETPASFAARILPNYWCEDTCEKMQDIESMSPKPAIEEPLESFKRRATDFQQTLSAFPEEPLSLELPVLLSFNEPMSLSRRDPHSSASEKPREIFDCVEEPSVKEFLQRPKSSYALHEQTHPQTRKF